jgi:hypothetical protein
LSEANVYCLQRALLTGIALACLLPSLALAQSPVPRHPWDVAFVAGGETGNARVPDDARYSDSWSRSGVAGAVVSRLWSTHVKTELEINTTGEGRQYIQREIRVPNYAPTVFVGGQQFTRVRQVAASVAWQFFDNDWVHPFVQLGIAVDAERQRRSMFPTTIYGGDPRSPNTPIVTIDARSEGPEERIYARGIVGAGVKLYVTERLFFRADTRATFAQRLEHLSFRAGLGVDF